MIRFLLFPFLVLACLNGSAQEHSLTDSLRTSLNSKQSLLKDRLFILCPDGAVNTPRPHKILSNPPSPEQETRITCDRGFDRLVIYAQEMNAFASKNLLEDVKNLYSVEERPGYSFRMISTADGMPAVLTTPIVQDSTQDAILINSALIQTSDSTLIQVGAYINPRAFILKKQYQALSEAMLESIKAGPRKLVFGTRLETLPMSGGLSSLVFDCPDKYIILPDLGFDYNTYQMRKMQVLTSHVPGGIIVYTGVNPTPLASTYGFTAEGAKTGMEMFLGKEREWSVYSDPGRNLYIRELICDAGEEGTGLKILVTLVASDQSEMKRLIRIAEKITKKSL